MSKYRIAQASAWLNLLGAFLVFVSFQGTSTDLLMVRTADGRTAFCVGPVSMFQYGAWKRPSHGNRLPARGEHQTNRCGQYRCPMARLSWLGNDPLRIFPSTIIHRKTN